MPKTSAIFALFLATVCFGCEHRNEQYEYAVFDTVGRSVSLPDGLVSADGVTNKDSDDVAWKQWHVLTKKLGGTGDEPNSPVAAVLNLLGRKGWKVVGFSDATTGGGDAAVFRYQSIVLMRVI